jgi:hypothetical protein
MARQGIQLAVAPDSTESREVYPTHEEIAALAYALWQKRGYPHGSPDKDWFRAEEDWFRAHEEASHVRRPF